MRQPDSESPEEALQRLKALWHARGIPAHAAQPLQKLGEGAFAVVELCRVTGPVVDGGGKVVAQQLASVLSAPETTAAGAPQQGAAGISGSADLTITGSKLHNNNDSPAILDGPDSTQAALVARAAGQGGEQRAFQQQGSLSSSSPFLDPAVQQALASSVTSGKQGPIPLPADWKGSNDAERGSWLAAVKRLKPAAESEPQLRRMFWNEAQLMLRLQHPAIVNAIGISFEGDEPGEADSPGALLLIQEHMKGVHLRRLITRAMIRANTTGQVLYSRRDAVRWGAQLARGLSYLHSRAPPVMHRDIKLENVMLTGEDPSTSDVKLIDFGLAIKLPGAMIQEAPAQAAPQRSAAAEASWTRSLSRLESLHSNRSPSLHRSTATAASAAATATHSTATGLYSNAAGGTVTSTATSRPLGTHVTQPQSRHASQSLNLSKHASGNHAASLINSNTNRTKRAISAAAAPAEGSVGLGSNTMAVPATLGGSTHTVQALQGQHHGISSSTPPVDIPAHSIPPLPGALHPPSPPLKPQTLPQQLSVLLRKLTADEPSLHGPSQPGDAGPDGAGGAGGMKPDQRSYQGSLFKALRLKGGQQAGGGAGGSAAAAAAPAESRSVHVGSGADGSRGLGGISEERVDSTFLQVPHTAAARESGGGEIQGARGTDGPSVSGSGTTVGPAYIATMLAPLLQQEERTSLMGSSVAGAELCARPRPAVPLGPISGTTSNDILQRLYQRRGVQGNGQAVEAQQRQQAHSLPGAGMLGGSIPEADAELSPPRQRGAAGGMSPLGPLTRRKADAIPITSGPLPRIPHSPLLVGSAPPAAGVLSSTVSHDGGGASELVILDTATSMGAPPEEEAQSQAGYDGFSGAGSLTNNNQHSQEVSHLNGGAQALVTVSSPPLSPLLSPTLLKAAAAAAAQVTRQQHQHPGPAIPDIQVPMHSPHQPPLNVPAAVPIPSLPLPALPPSLVEQLSQQQQQLQLCLAAPTSEAQVSLPRSTTHSSSQQPYLGPGALSTSEAPGPGGGATAGAEGTGRSSHRRGGLYSLLQPIKSLRLEDFQAVSMRLHTLTSRTGSLLYMAPEVFKGEPYNCKADVFSFGVCLYELLHVRVVLNSVLQTAGEDDKQGAILKYASAVAAGYRPPISPYLPASLKELLQQCWSTNPLERPNMDVVAARLEAVLQEERDLLDALDSSAAAAGGAACCAGRCAIS